VVGLATVQPLFRFWGLAASPNPAAKGFASGLLHSLALASTLPRPFRTNQRKGMRHMLLNAANKKINTILDTKRVMTDYKK
jgi:hypothetical protein